MTPAIRATTTWDVVPLGLFPVLAELTLKAAVVVLATLALAWCLRRHSAAARHLLWLAAFALLVLLPAVVALAPDWRVLPAPQATAAAPLHVQVARVGGAPAGMLLARPRSPVGARTGAAAASWHRPPATMGSLLTRGLGALWAAGLLLIVLRYALGTIGVRRWMRGARPLADRGWESAVATARATVGLASVPRLLEVPAADVPLVWGVRRPVVFVPPAAHAWSAERRALVLTHELAHVRRGDVLVEALVQLACAIFWFHPAVWYAARRLRLERERACDDAVVAGGARPSVYAAHLMAIVDGLTHARAGTRRAPPIVALCVARLDDFDARLAALLQARSRRQTPAAVFRAAVAVGAAALLAVVGPAMLRRPVLRGGQVPHAASMVFTDGPRGAELRFIGADADARRFVDSLRAARRREGGGTGAGPRAARPVGRPPVAP